MAASSSTSSSCRSVGPGVDDQLAGGIAVGEASTLPDERVDQRLQGPVSGGDDAELGRIARQLGIGETALEIAELLFSGGESGRDVPLGGIRLGHAGSRLAVANSRKS